MRFLHDTIKAIKQPFLRQPPATTKNPKSSKFSPHKNSARASIKSS
ncbi:hypothetical protein E5E06_00375 [Helicobacter pylori]|nr:hypothetical protein [Helicobacter pylori]WRD99250.1 hypothetical protein E5E06_00375 [Helicobacter pylori]